MKSFCREFGHRQAVKVDFAHGNVPTHLPQELSLCLYRVMQEALQNAAKHSHVKHFEVKLDCSASQVDLIISDRGTGFECGTIMSKGGLGLITMRERVRLLNGTITIDSKPMCGTRVHVRVPLTVESTPHQQS
jgi:signal transduction histidine kinase